MQETGAFVVQVLAVGDRALAERFSEVRPPIRGPFERLQVAESPWGLVLGGSRPRAACRLAGSAPVGHGELVEGVIEQLELPDLEDPLVYLHGRYQSVGDLPRSRLRSWRHSPARELLRLAEAVGRELAELDLPAR
jgi:flavin reductase (DIM6/NTAB) family NADH-FMN oxidoreductase RutF